MLTAHLNWRNAGRRVVAERNLKQIDAERQVVQRAIDAQEEEKRALEHREVYGE